LGPAIESHQGLQMI